MRRIRGVLAFGSAAALALGATVPAWAHDITERVSVGKHGVQGDSDSYSPRSRPTGGSSPSPPPATWCRATPTATLDVFVRDRQTGTTLRVSVGPGGVQGDMPAIAPSISADGRFVAFMSVASNLVPGDTNGDA